MKQISLSLLSRFLILTAILTFGGFNLQSQDKAESKTKYKENVIRIKFEETSTGYLDIMSQKPLVKTEDGVIQTGIASVDQLNKQYKVKKLTRVFPPAGKFEDRHKEWGLHLWYELTFDEKSIVDVMESTSNYSSTKEIRIAEPIYEKSLTGYVNGFNSLKDNNPSPSFITDDPQYTNQWHYDNSGQTGGTPGADISLSSAWDIQMGSDNVIVSVVDGGIDVTHEDLSSSMWVNQAELNGTAGVDDDGNGYIDDINGYNFADGTGALNAHFHGTHVGGTIGAVTNNGIGVSGVAGGTGSGDGVRLMSCAVFGDIYTGGFDQAYVYAADNGAVISQNSWGYTSPGVFEQSVLDAIDYFIANAGYDEFGNPFGPMNGGIVIFSAGNGNADGEYYPGYYEPCLAVASTNHTDERAYYSNFGTWVDIAAPGGETINAGAEGVYSTYPGNSYAYLQGTSMACPHVSGVAALIVSEYGDGSLSPQMVWDRLVQTTDAIDAVNPGYEGLLGSGRLDAYNALQVIDDIPPAAIMDLVATDQTFNSVTLGWTATGASDSDGKASSYELRYADFPIDAGNFETAILVSGTPSPKMSGESEVFVVTGLNFDTEYYFAIKAIDLGGYISDISNVAITTTDLPPVIGVSPESYELFVNSNEIVPDVLSIDNSAGASPLEFSLRKSYLTAPSEAAKQWTNEIQTEEISIQEVSGLMAEYQGNRTRSVKYIPANVPELNAPGDTEVMIFTDDSSDPSEIADLLDAYADLSVTIVREGEISSVDDFMVYDVVIVTNNYAWTDPANLGDILADFVDLGGLLTVTCPTFYTSSFGLAGRLVDEGYMPVNSGLSIGYGELGSYDANHELMQDVSTFSGDIIITDLSPSDGAEEVAQLSGGGTFVAVKESVIAVNVFVGSAGNWMGDVPQLFYNCVTFSAIDWIEFSTLSGIVDAGASLDLDIAFNSTGLFGGDYTASIDVYSNDPVTPMVSVPATMHVTALPEIEVSTDSLLFGEAFSGYSDSLILFVRNIGTDTLVVNSIYTDNIHFAAEFANIVVDPLDEFALKVWYYPNELQIDEGLLYLESNDADNTPVVVTLIGESVIAPEIVITPSSFEVDLLCGETLSRYIHISNVGGSDLLVNCLLPGVIDPTGVFTSTKEDTHSHDYSIDEAREIVISKPDSDQAIEELNQIKIFADDMEGGINGWRTEVYGIDDLWHQSTLNPMSPVTSWYCGIDAQFNYETFNQINTAVITPEIDVSGLTKDSLYLIFAESYETEPGWDYCMVDISTDGGTTWIPLRGDYGSAPAGSSGGWITTIIDISDYIGEVISIRFYFDTGDGGVNNLPGWFFDDVTLSTTAMPDGWLSVHENTLVIPAGMSDSAEVYFNGGLIPASGTYISSVLLNSNDPATPQEVVACTLTVTGPPEMVLSDTCFNFGHVHQAESKTKSLLIYNTGCDPLIISDITSSLLEFEVDKVSMTVSPGSVDTVNITFSPSANADFDGELTIFSNDVDTIICLSGIGAPEQEFFFHKFPEGVAPSVDGTVDDIWDNIQVHHVNKQFLGEDPYTFSRASWQAGWNDTSLFILVVVEDDDFYPPWESGDETWMSDKPEIYLDVNDELIDGFGPSAEGTGHYGISPDFVEGFSQFDSSGYISVWPSFVNMSYAYNISDPNYVFEYAVNIQSLIKENGDTLNPFINDVIGFDVTVVDRDDDGLSRKRAVWMNKGNIAESWANMDDCGEMAFCGGNSRSPELGLSDTCLSFGEIVMGENLTETLYVYNIACDDTLRISDISSTLGEFSADKTTMTIPPGSFDMVNITFTPSAISEFNGELNIFSNDVDSVICLSGIGVEPPLMAVTPDFIDVELVVGAETEESIVIDNSAGGSDLHVDLSLVNASAPATASAYIPRSIPDYIPFSTAIDEFENTPVEKRLTAADNILVIQDYDSWGVNMFTFILDNFSIASDVISYIDIAGTDFSNYDLIITTGSQSGSYYNAVSANVAKFEDFAESGGIIQYQLATQGDNVSLAGGADMLFGNQEDYNIGIELDHPILDGAPEILPGNSANHCYLNNLPGNALVITETQASGLPTTVEYTLGSGTVIATGMTWEFLYNNGYESGILLYNAVAYSLELASIDWIQIPELEYTIPDGSSVTVPVSISAVELDTGQYYANIIVRGDDPLNPADTVLCSLNVIDSSEMVSLVFTSEPQTVYTGYFSSEIPMTLELQDNTGSPSDADSDLTIELTTTSPTGEFSLDTADWINISTVEIPSGTHSAEFFYRDNTVGTSTVTASETPDRGWSDAEQILSVESSVLSQTPHAVAGTVETSTGTIPVNGELAFSAFITSRPSEIITETSTGCGYADGYWWAQCSSLPTGWAAGETMHIEFTDAGSGEAGSVEVILSNDPADDAGLVILGLYPPVILSYSVEGTSDLKFTLEEIPGDPSFNVYRDTYADFTPDKAGGTNRIATGVTDEDPVEENVQWTDVGAVGNPDMNYFYIFTSVGANESDNSSIIGEFDYGLITTATTDFNEIALPLNIEGVTNAEELMAAIPGCNSVAYWNAAEQGYYQYISFLPTTNFEISMGYPYYVNVTDDVVFTLIGEPVQPCFSLITTPTTDFNDIMLTLDKTDITLASELMADIPSSNSIARWDAAGQGFYQYISFLPPTNFEVSVGYPYYVNVASDVIWPELCAEEGSAYLKSTSGDSERQESLEKRKTPHMAYGTIQINDAGINASEIDFSAYFRSLPGEILDKNSIGCTLQDDYWVVQCSSFPSGWEAGEDLIVEFRDKTGALLTETEVELTFSPADRAVGINSPDLVIEGGMGYILGQNTPNPFGYETHIQYLIPEYGFVQIEVYSITGQKVRTLVNDYMEEGSHTLVWDAQDDSGNELEEGIYTYMLRSRDKVIIRKALIIK